MTKGQKTAANFMALSEKVLNPSKFEQFIIPSSFDEKVSFHKIHDEFLKRGNDKTVILLENRYPFVKIKGSWHVMAPKLFLYLIAARGLLCQFEDDSMKRVYQSVQDCQKYLKEAKRIDKQMEVSGFKNHEDYTEKVSRAWELHNEKQLSIFGC